MLVGAGDHEHVVPGHPHVAAEDVGGHTETGDVADVAGAVGVRPGDGGQDLAHGREPSERGNPVAPPGRTLGGRPVTDLVDDLDTTVAAAVRRAAHRVRPRLGRAGDRADLERAGRRRARRRRPVRLRRPDRHRDAGARGVRPVHLLGRPAGEARADDPRRRGGGQRRRRPGPRRLRRHARPRWPGPAPPTCAATTPTASPTPTASRRWAPSRRCCTCTTWPLRWASRGTPTRTSYDACWTGSSRTHRPTDDPWPTLLRRHRPRPGGTAGLAGGGTARSAEPAAQAQRSSSAGDLGLELAEAAPLVGGVLVGPGEPHGVLGDLAEVPLQGEQLEGVRRERLGPAAGLDVGEPGLVRPRPRRAPRAGRARAGPGRGRPSRPAAGRRGCRSGCAVCGSPCVTTHRSTLPATAAPSSTNRRSAALDDRAAPRRAAARPAPTRGRRSSRPGRGSARAPRARRRVPADPRPPDAAGAAAGAGGAGRRAGRPRRPRPASSSNGPAPAVAVQVRREA